MKLTVRADMLLAFAKHTCPCSTSGAFSDIVMDTLRRYEPRASGFRAVDWVGRLIFKLLGQELPDEFRSEQEVALVQRHRLATTPRWKQLLVFQHVREESGQTVLAPVVLALKGRHFIEAEVVRT